MAEPPFDPAAMLAALAGADVRFVLIGGMAAVLHGDVGVTIDIDITPAYDPDNLHRLAKALRTIDARIRTDAAPHDDNRRTSFIDAVPIPSALSQPRIRVTS